MTKYKVTLMFNDKNIKSVQKKVKEMFGGDAETVVEKVVNPSSRNDRYQQAESDFDTVKEEVEMLRDELQEWLDNLPENLQGGDKASELEEAISNLDSTVDSLDNVSFESVEFPGMF